MMKWIQLMTGGMLLVYETFKTFPNSILWLLGFWIFMLGVWGLIKEGIADGEA